MENPDLHIYCFTVDSIIDSLVLFLILQSISSIYFFNILLSFFYHYHFVILSCIIAFFNKGDILTSNHHVACRCLRVETQWLLSSDIAYLCLLYRALIYVVVIPPCYVHSKIDSLVLFLILNLFLLCISSLYFCLCFVIFILLPCFAFFVC